MSFSKRQLALICNVIWTAKSFWTNYLMKSTIVYYIFQYNITKLNMISLGRICLKTIFNIAYFALYFILVPLGKRSIFYVIKKNMIKIISYYIISTQLDLKSDYILVYIRFISKCPVSFSLNIFGN